MIVVDASVVVQVLIADDLGLALADRLAAQAEELAAPHLLDLEVASALRTLARSRAVSAAIAASAIADLRALRIERHSHAEFLTRIWALRDELTIYDAAYVALAEALHADLWTRDRRLSRARLARCRIELL